MFKFIKDWFKLDVDVMNCIHISESALLHNYNYLQSLKPQASLFPVLKSNAYGHWIDQMLQIYKWLPIKYVVVDSFPEYYTVLKHSKFNILLLGETLASNYKVFNFKRTAFCVYNLETLQTLAKLWKKVRIHLFLNTGMNREWIDSNLLQNALEFLKWCPQIEIEWVLSHLHSADAMNEKSIESQISAFKMMYHQILDYGHTPKYRHIWASAWLLKIHDDFFNAYRPWLALYWYNPLSDKDSDFSFWEELQPALSLSSTIVALNSVLFDEGVSYAPQWKQTKKSDQITATIPFGYMEWLPRYAREKIQIRHSSWMLSQIWTVCMNLSCYLWNEKLLIGDKVWLLEKEKGVENSIYSLAKVAWTIPYDILVHLDKWIRRVIEK